MYSHANIEPNVLIVDEKLANLSLLADILEEGGFQARRAASGNAAMSLALQKPELILLSANLPDMDGLTLCRYLKDKAETASIPIIFVLPKEQEQLMPLTLAAGCVDCVVHPVSAAALLARIQTHIPKKQVAQQRTPALDAYGKAALAIHPETGYLSWQTPLARRLLLGFFEQHTVPSSVLIWLRQLLRYGTSQAMWSIYREGRHLHIHFTARTEEGDCLLLLNEEFDISPIARLVQSLGLTNRESEVLYWLTQDKSSADIANILSSSPRAVDRHLQHIYQKLGVETRMAAVACATEKLQTN